MQTKEQRHQYYLRNREKIIGHNSKYKKEHRARATELDRARRVEHPEDYRAYNKEYARKNTMRVNGAYVRAHKRPYPPDECCELCRKQRQLVYHHWDDELPELGMWICRGCHFKAEDAERGWPIKYLALKKKLEDEILLDGRELLVKLSNGFMPVADSNMSISLNVTKPKGG